MIWCDDKFPLLSACMVKIFCGPALTAGVERNHKVGANVHTALRNRLGNGKVERQVAVAHNANVAKRGGPELRHPFAHFMAKMFDPDADVIIINDKELNLVDRRPTAIQADGQDVEDALYLLLTPDECLEQVVLHQSLEGSTVA
ncbi:hypothetical protein SPRG_15549 [Saprolegnia parasitica CBS 223.65]|uniref:Uncharacterized protein n=1 Tax=Saprolegnia parasitica (strain CBS 223.65) TaxID=695850 RepID=A0A067BLD5_SAPPC|nr:hypothetical protein SPRG_15549 [Saprolegnia parasitica CBS 223.65]KDO19279.1 hypothetical protein SPRG_15549 [Saprolegnia parasitica CBS 223.65]|eukprot:XP_012210022.1 hypothetical protein SPRG_15549 [Saprolegnia parasitica CBS 223.65]